MNRAERRRLNRVVNEVDNPTYYKLTVSQLDQLKKDVSKEVEIRCIKILFSIPMKVGKEQCGWTDEECQMFAEAICDEYQEHLKGNSMSVDEYVRLTERITGMKFE